MQGTVLHIRRSEGDARIRARVLMKSGRRTPYAWPESIRHQHFSPVRNIINMCSYHDHDAHRSPYGAHYRRLDLREDIQSWRESRHHFKRPSKQSTSFSRLAGGCIALFDIGDFLESIADCTVSQVCFFCGRQVSLKRVFGSLPRVLRGGMRCRAHLC
jgi:hypothetical protein